MYSFTPSTSGPYVASVDSSNFDTTVYVATDCTTIDTTCLSAADECTKDCTESTKFDAVSGTTYYIFVDGWQTTATPGNAGPFTLSVAPPPPGDTCSSAIPISAVPFTDTGNTKTAINDYGYSMGACPPETGGWGAKSSDLVYSLNPSVTGSYTITLTGFNSTLYVVTDCSNVDSTCLAGDESCSAPTCAEKVTANLTAGTTYFIIVDGYDNSSNVSGAYTINVVKNP